MSTVTEKTLYMLRSMYPTETVVEMLQHEEFMLNAEAMAHTDSSNNPMKGLEFREKIYTVDEAIIDLARFDTRLLSNFPHLMNKDYLQSDAENYEEFLKQEEGV